MKPERQNCITGKLDTPVSQGRRGVKALPTPGSVNQKNVEYSPVYRDSIKIVVALGVRRYREQSQVDGRVRITVRRDGGYEWENQPGERGLEVRRWSTSGGDSDGYITASAIEVAPVHRRLPATHPKSAFLLPNGNEAQTSNDRYPSYLHTRFPFQSFIVPF
ncbi:hypothetical protein J6590_039044 [Homalodisca vitripennis]|nr:hypothetical protein J6590_039044 [Homalodisca vitripennis]